MLRTILLWVPMALALALHAQSPTIRGYEYWFNQNHASRVFVPVAPATSVNLNNVPLNTAALPVGTHIVHLRLKDQDPNGAIRWSTVVTRTFEKYHSGPWAIVAVRYWVGNPTNEFDPLIRTRIFDSPHQVINYANSPLDLCGYPTGNQTLQLQLKDNHGQWSSVVTRSVTVNPAGTLGLPVIAASPAQSSFCPGEVVTFTATPPSGPNIALPGAYTWTIPSGSGWSHVPSTGNTITVTIGNTGGTVQVFSTNQCGTSATASFPVSIPTTPAQPSAIQPSAACAGSATTFSVTGVAGVTYQWSASGGTPATGGPGATFTTALSGNATITVTPMNGCGVPGPLRTAQISVSQPSNAGTNGNLTTCSSSAAQSLFAQLGGNPSTGGTWSPSATTGNYDPATMNPGVYTYTVAGVGACPNATATVTVVEHQAPNAGGNGTLSTCSNGASVSLFAQLSGAPQGGGAWIGPSATTGSYNPATMDPGVYTYTVSGIAPCPSASATVTVSEAVAPNPGTNGSLALCETSAPSDLFAALGGNPQQDGAWSGPSAITGTFNPANMLQGPYTYTVSGNAPCANASATVTVTVNSLPNAGTGGSLEICSNGSPAALFSQLGGTPEAGGTWSPNAPGGSYDPASMDPGAYTYTVNGIAPCPNASSTVSVSETAAPDAGGNGTLLLCAYSEASSLFEALDGTPQVGGTWTGPSDVDAGQYDPATMTPGTYSYTVGGTDPCSDASATVLVRVPVLDLTAVTGPTGIEFVQATTYMATPTLADADSILWSFPASWNWDPSDTDRYDPTAILLPTDSAGIYSVCATAIGGGCIGAEVCLDAVNVSVGITSHQGATPFPILVYPNPSRGIVKVVFETMGEDLHFELYDATGRRVLDLGRNTTSFSMDLAYLAAGSYTLTWRSKKTLGQQRLLIQR